MFILIAADDSGEITMTDWPSEEVYHAASQPAPGLLRVPRGRAALLLHLLNLLRHAVPGK